MSTVIKVEGLGKQYRLGEVGTGTLSHDLNRWWARIRGKEDPFSKIGEINDRTKKGESEYVWALKDINFEVKQGEVLGIIGRNGAGKSTLLKILSKVTKPSAGRIKTKGRIASLLEVGTGFHPEMTGRENVFLNAAIMGMHRQEIKNKFDEIVDFAGVERYIDTPVKRYSSGMYVRLAFGVAAHLEPEILIVDEVLAVGDAEFQKRALGKMKEVSDSEGRTVLFVSHNMAAIKQLCTKTILMQNGGIVFEGKTNDGIDQYLKSNQYEGYTGIYTNDSIEKSGIVSLVLVDGNKVNKTEYGFDEPITIKIKIKIEEKHLTAHLGFRVVDKNERVIFTSEIKLSTIIKTAGLHEFEVKLPVKFLVPNKYNLTFALHIPNIILIDCLDDCLSFEIIETGSEFYPYQGKDFGCVFIDCDWSHFT